MNGRRRDRRRAGRGRSSTEGGGWHRLIERELEMAGMSHPPRTQDANERWQRHQYTLLKREVVAVLAHPPQTRDANRGGGEASCTLSNHVSQTESRRGVSSSHSPTVPTPPNARSRIKSTRLLWALWASMIGRVVLRSAFSLLIVIVVGLHEMAGLGASIRAVLVLMGIQLAVGGLDAMTELDGGRNHLLA